MNYTIEITFKKGNKKIETKIFDNPSSAAVWLEAVHRRELRGEDIKSAMRDYWAYE